MRLFVVFFFVLSFFLLAPSLAKEVSVLLIYREDIPFYQRIARKISEKAKNQIALCTLKDWPLCFDERHHRYVLVFGDLAYQKVLPRSFRKVKVFAFFVTKCEKKDNVCCCHLFPTLREVVQILRRQFPKHQFMVLYTPKTKWWIQGYRSSLLSFFCLDVKDLKESLRRAFNSKARVYILAPDFLFMHPAFLKDVVRYSFLFSKVLVGLSPKMQQYGVPVVIFHDYESFWSNFDFELLFTRKLDIPIRLSVASWYTEN